VNYADLTGQLQPSTRTDLHDQPGVEPKTQLETQLDPQLDAQLDGELASFGEPDPAGDIAGLIADLAAIAEADPADPDQLDMLALLETLTDEETQISEETQ